MISIKGMNEEGEIDLGDVDLFAVILDLVHESLNVPWKNERSHRTQATQSAATHVVLHAWPLWNSEFPELHLRLGVWMCSDQVVPRRPRYNPGGPWRQVRHSVQGQCLEESHVGYFVIRLEVDCYPL